MQRFAVIRACDDILDQRVYPSEKVLLPGYECIKYYIDIILSIMVDKGSCSHQGWLSV